MNAVKNNLLRKYLIADCAGCIYYTLYYEEQSHYSKGQYNPEEKFPQVNEILFYVDILLLHFSDDFKFK